MGMIVIKKVVYRGDKYYFESPDLNDGIVILEGENEHGKSTFMDLIYFGLGGKVSGFNKSDKNAKDKHTQIYNDSNNSVELLVKINEELFEFTRPFIENKIYITDENATVIETNIYRNSGENNQLFSDWLLDKLGIEVFDIIQGTKSFKIGFSDLMRLIYHDQKTEVDKIYKSPENDNFVSDSLEVRKAIFEVLIGAVYNDYYSELGKYKLKNKEFEDENCMLANYDDFIKEVVNEELKNAEAIKETIRDKKEILSRLDIERNIARSKKTDTADVFNEIEIQKDILFDNENNRMNNIKIKRSIQDSINKILFLIEEADREIKEIEKIRFVNKKLKLFSPNTCPYCLREVGREEGKCICGSDIDEDEYEKFFYSDDEYLEILKVKKRSKESLILLLENKNDRLKDVEKTIEKIDNSINSISCYINDLRKDINSNYNSAYIAKIDDRIKDTKEEIGSLETAKELAEKKESFVGKVGKIRRELESIKIRVNQKFNMAQEDMLDKKSDFNEVYFELMKKSDTNCFDAYLGNDYMPYTNNGEYRARSSLVSKRLMYFLTMLIMSVKYNINYPRFLMIDTPNKEGIDPEKLIRILEQLSKVGDYKENENIKFQIILTTGEGVYPKEFKKYVFLNLKNNNKLLIERK